MIPLKPFVVTVIRDDVFKEIHAALAHEIRVEVGCYLSNDRPGLGEVWECNDLVMLELEEVLCNP